MSKQVLVLVSSHVICMYVSAMSMHFVLPFANKRHNFVK